MLKKPLSGKLVNAFVKIIPEFNQSDTHWLYTVCVALYPDALENKWETKYCLCFQGPFSNCRWS